MRIRPAFVRIAVALIATAVSLIAAAADKDDLERRADKLRAGPSSAPSSNDTGFSKGLKCMDSLFRTYGISNVAVVLDTIPDATKKINVGARDMFMSATADMTRTTHAIRLIPIVESRVFTDTKRERVIADADFAIQGSISQFDESMLEKQRDGAVCIWKLCIGAADSDKISGLGLDLNLVDTAGMSLVPGASVKNAVLLRKHGNGYDGDLTVTNFSAQFNFTLSTADSNGQALRTLIELGTIELYGRMLKVPYWTCLGATDQDPAVSSEIDDWWEEMAADPRNSARLMGYLQLQMKAQGLYEGEINGIGSEALLRSVRAYELALGMSDDLNLDARFLRKYLAADHAQVRKLAVLKLAEINLKEGPLPPEPVAQAAPQGGPTGPGASTAQATRQSPSVALTQEATAGPTAPAVAAAPTAQNAPTGQGAAIAQSTQSPEKLAMAPSGPATQAGQPVAARPAPTAPIASVAPGAAVPAAAVAPVSSPAPVGAANPAAPQSVAAAHPAQPPATTSVQRAVYHAPQPVATIPIEGSRPANNAAYRAGEPFFVGVISPRDGYLYCYLVDGHQRVSQLYPAPEQSPTRLSGGTLTVVNSGSPLLARPERKDKVACFSSPKDLGRQPLEPESVLGLEALKTRFAIAVSGAYAMGVFDVKVQ